MTGGPFTSLYEARGCQTADEHATAVEQAAGHAKDSGVAHQNLCETKIFGRLKQAAAKMLSGRFGLKVQELRDPATLITAVTRQERLERFRPPRRKEHLTQLVAAYCLSLLMEN